MLDPLSQNPSGALVISDMSSVSVDRISSLGLPVEGTKAFESEEEVQAARLDERYDLGIPIDGSRSLEVIRRKCSMSRQEPSATPLWSVVGLGELTVKTSPTKAWWEFSRLRGGEEKVCFEIDRRTCTPVAESSRNTLCWGVCSNRYMCFFQCKFGSTQDQKEVMTQINRLRDEGPNEAERKRMASEEEGNASVMGS